MRPLSAAILVVGALVCITILKQPASPPSAVCSCDSPHAPLQAETLPTAAPQLGSDQTVVVETTQEEQPQEEPSSLFVSLFKQSPEVRRARQCEKDPSLQSQQKSTYHAEIEEYLEAHRCLGIGKTTSETTTLWDGRLPVSAVKRMFPSLLPLHGGVAPATLVRQARLMALLLGMDRYVAGLTAMLNGNVYRKNAVQDGLEALGYAAPPGDRDEGNEPRGEPNVDKAHEDPSDPVPPPPKRPKQAIDGDDDDDDDKIAPSAMKKKIAIDRVPKSEAPSRTPKKQAEPGQVADADSSNLVPKDVIVEIGCGNAGLLFLMCPPVPDLACFGADFAPRLIAHGQHHIPWIDLRVDIFAPHLPTGSASGALSHGVMMMLTPPQACGHIDEMLRLLKPQGRAVLWGLTPKPFRSRFHPSFFHENEDGSVMTSFFRQGRSTVSATRGKFLQFCPSLSRYVQSVLFVMHGSRYPLFTPGVDYFFAAVIERSNVSWSNNNDGSQAQQRRPTTSYPTELPLAAYRKHAQRIEPIIREQEGLHRYSDAADGVPSLLHYMTLANTTALHMHRRKGPQGRYWSAEQNPLYRSNQQPIGKVKSRKREK